MEELLRAGEDGGTGRGEPRTSRDDTKAELQRIARFCGLTVGMVSQVASSPVGFGAIVETAAAEATNCPVTGVQAVYCWTAASGIAHAQRWAVMSAALQRTMVPGAPEGSTRLALSASEEALIGTAYVAVPRRTAGPGRRLSAGRRPGAGRPGWRGRPAG